MNMNISSQTRTINIVKSNGNVKKPYSKVDNKATSDNKEKDMHSSIKELTEDGIIYQNPLLMAQAVENAVSEVKQFQPEMVRKYKVNPVKAIYDSEKAHDWS